MIASWNGSVKNNLAGACLVPMKQKPKSNAFQAKEIVESSS
jgi:hypothetical protein